MKNIVEYKQCQVFKPYVRFVNRFSLEFSNMFPNILCYCSFYAMMLNIVHNVSVVYHRICKVSHLSLVFCWYTHEPSGSWVRIPRKQKRLARDIPWWISQKRCISSIFTCNRKKKKSLPYLLYRCIELSPRSFLLEECFQHMVYPAIWWSPCSSLAG